MKKISLFIAATFLISSIITSCSTADASKKKEGKTDNTYKDLIDLGFSNSKSQEHIYAYYKAKYYEKYNLNFIGDLEMDSIIKVNGFMIAMSTQYTGEVPPEVAKMIIHNYKKFAPSDIFAQWVGKWYTVQDDFAGFGFKGIYIIAHPQYFTPESRPGFDPIAAVKVEYGWMELARWE